MREQWLWTAVCCTAAMLSSGHARLDLAQEPASVGQGDWGFAALFTPLPTGQEVGFTGKWMIDKESTGLDGLPDVTIEISVTEEAIHFKKTQADRPRDIVWDMTLSPDGREGTYRSVRGNELRCSGQVVDGRLVILSVSEAVRNGRVVFRDMREEYRLSADGTQMFLSQWSTLNGRTSTPPRPIVFGRVIE